MEDLHPVVGVAAANEGSPPDLAARKSGAFEFCVGAADRADRHAEFLGQLAMRRQALPRFQLTFRYLLGQGIGDSTVTRFLRRISVQLN